MIELQFSLSSDTLLAKLSALDGELPKRAQRALDQSAAAILSHLRTGFLAETDPHGTPWIPSKAGLERKSRGTGQTLFKTGRLFRSLQLYVDGDLERRIGTDVPYALELQRGRTPRVFLEISEAHEKLARSIFVAKIQELLNE